MNPNPIPEKSRSGRAGATRSPEEDATNHGAEVRVLARGLAVLQAFRPRNAALTNSELATLVGLPRSTISRITAMLLQLGYLEYQIEQARYRLSASVLTLGFSSMATSYARQLAQEHMHRFAEANDLLIVLAVRDGVMMVCQSAVRGRGALTIRMEEGSRIALPHGAMGRAWLASLAPKPREALWLEAQKAYPGGMSRAEFEDSLRQYSRRGFCVAVSKLEPDLLGVATMLQLPGELEMCVLGCAVPAFRYRQSSSQEELGEKMIGLRNAITQALAVIDHPAED
ncbi:MAG: IclR family transcriptional regulator [Ottowia sp.]|uniref:IclR family transcriptional regulator n=1 Tax=Ottowia sp. TaxID=1898956 RepID=UPI003C72826B